MFSDSDDDSGQNVQLTVNEHYAKAFQAKKEREELEKCTSLRKEPLKKC
jgi:protein KRI1